MTTSADPREASPPVDQLLTERAALQQWLDRLHEAADEVSERVFARVRADYQERLSRVDTELGAHVDALQSQLHEQRARLAEAEEAHESAVDDLEEQRLRQHIGELSEADWQSRRGALEQAVSEAESRRDQLRDEVARLSEVLQQVEDGTRTLVMPEPAQPLATPEAPPAQTGSATAAAPFPAPDDQTLEAPPEPEVESEDLAFLQELDPERDSDADLAFLQELDRAIAPEAPAPAVGQPPAAASDPEPRDSDEEYDPQTRPSTGVRCAACGYTNDASAWYCGVCGVDLA